MKTVEQQKCRSCGATIYWLLNPKTGKSAPIEAEPNPKGNILLQRILLGEYEIIPAAARASYAGMLHLNHFASCPQAPSWHKYAKGGRQ